MNKAKICIPLFLIFIMAFTQEVCCLPTLEIKVYTDKTSYMVEEDIHVYGEVTIDGSPVENATVALEVRDPTASPVVIKTLNTTISGSYDHSFKLSSQALLGKYTVNVSCNYGGERATNTTSFTLEEASVFAVTVEMGRSAYKVGEVIEIFGDVTQAGVPVEGALVAVEVQDPEHSSIVMRGPETNGDGLYTVTFRLPTGSPTGIYSVHANAIYEEQRAFANTTFQVKHEISTDINGDGSVNILDIALVAKAYGSYPGHPRWDSRCDLDGSGVINILDVAMVAREYGTGSM